MKYVGTSHAWDQLHTHRDKYNYIIEHIPKILSENGEMRMCDLSHQLTGRPYLLSAWIQKGEARGDIVNKLSDKVEFYNNSNGKKLTFARLRQSSDTCVGRLAPYWINSAGIFKNKSTIDECVEALLEAVAEKAREDMGLEIGRLNAKIAELEADKRDLERAANNTITNKYFNFKSV